jgi:hypothetical protein
MNHYADATVTVTIEGNPSYVARVTSDYINLDKPTTIQQAVATALDFARRSLDNWNDLQQHADLDERKQRNDDIHTP